ncbi:CLUMA_CG001869, isoform A [Clunio marinus]|uniref:CLUMA_CG001869, isoform A n=1 Tax=Clunio marinus TaxID=568069 RepID=A0A1J1HL03_9DIPT|nr:CLUMA_CG001869, isoform A [Clunio marinus]
MEREESEEKIPESCQRFDYVLGRKATTKLRAHLKTFISQTQSNIQYQQNSQDGGTCANYFSTINRLQKLD